jgi:wyosine [tRNA(Phe)-imidazoG37] synthetase (radical SAM superfamily)
MTGKGSTPRPFAVDKKTFNDNFDNIFNKREREQITEVTITFNMKGNPTLYDMKKEVEKMCKENKIVCTTTTKYI